MEVDKNDHSEVPNSEFKFYKGGKKRVTWKNEEINCIFLQFSDKEVNKETYKHIKELQ